MNATETIQAAIDKLESQRDAPHGEDIISTTSRDALELVVTLHRTIDPQLAILRQALHAAEEHRLFFDAEELYLARAILGERQ